MLRMIDALYVWYHYGPYFKHLNGLCEQITKFHQPFSHTNIAPFKWLLIALLVGWTPYFTAHWHWDYGHPEIWGPIAANQATNASSWINIYVMSVVMVCPKRRLLATVMVFLGNILQYGLCFEMFMNAEVPYMHLVDLVIFSHTLGCLGYVCWFDKSGVNDKSNHRLTKE